MPDKRIFTLFSIFIFLGLGRLCSQPSVKFKHLKVQDGLSQSWVKAICQDQLGFMWFGTNDGLNKYNGYSVTSYYHNSEDKNSLPNNSINTIYSDSTGHLWIGTDRGFCLYDPGNDQFIHPSQWSVGVIIQFLELSEGHFLILTRDRGLLVFDRKMNSIEPCKIFTNKASSKNVASMLKDRRGNIWFRTNSGLKLFQPSVNKTYSYNIETTNSHDLTTSNIKSLLEDSHGRIWAGSENNGLFLLHYEIDHPEKAYFTHFTNNAKARTSINPGAIKSLLEDQAGLLWIGLENSGLDIIDLNNFHKENAAFHHHQFNPFDNTSLSNNSIYSLYEDRYGGIWIGTYGNGINYYNPQKNKFTHIRQELNNPNSINNNFVTAFWEEGDSLWIGTEGGLNLYNQKDGKYRHFVHDPGNKQTICSNSIWSLFRDSRNNLWIGTWAGGLNLFNEATGTFTRFNHDKYDSGTISSNNIFSIHEDQTGILWICTMGDGINQFDNETKTFKIFRQDSDSNHRLSNDMVSTAIEDSYGKIWISTSGGVDVYDRLTDTLEHFLPDTSDTKSLNSHVIVFFEDSRKNLWLGTRDGLNVFNRDENNFEHFTTKHGLPNNQIKGILEDDHGNLWISSNKGLSNFIQAATRPDEPKFKNYDLDDGLQGIEFTVRACFRGRDGRMYFGGNNGFNVFHPDSIKDNISIPPVLITNLFIDNKRQPIRDPNSLHAKHNHPLKKITLNHKQSVFTIEYVMFNYFSSNKNKYAYMLEGFDKDWNNAGNQRFATYTNMDPGDYIFRVKGRLDNDGKQTEATIDIKVIPPWWKTNWAYLLYFAITGFIMFNIWRFQLNKRAMKHSLMLEHQHAEKLEELNTMKSRFFANITHEFRSPLTLIMGPVQQIAASEMKTDIQEVAGMILRNCRQMLHLINQILELSKLESGYVKLQTRKADIITLIEKVIHLYTTFAENKNINIQLFIPDDMKLNSSIELYIDVDKIEKVVINLLSNALKYTPENGQVIISIQKISGNHCDPFNRPDKKEKKEHDDLNPRFHKKYSENHPVMNSSTKLLQNGFIELCVKDNGIGIRDKDLNKIFDRFYQGFDPNSGAYESVGIGLALTKELIELHSGTIHVESSYGQGTEFYIRLPLGRDHLLPSEIILNSDDDVDFVSQAYNELSDDKTVPDEKEATNHNQFPIILIIDDNADIRSYMAGHLRNEYHIVTAKDGLDGLEKAKNLIPDLIISDVMMPNMNGIELCSAIKTDELTNHIPIILLTVRASDDSKIEGLDIGADDYITKPFEIKELKARIRNLIEQRRQLQKKYNRGYGLQPSEIASSSADERFLKKTLSLLEANISESDFGVEQLARELSVHRTQLYRKLRAITGQTAVEFIRSVRLNRAAQLLKKKHDNIAQIAYEVGFSNPSYFSSSFHKQFGMYPTEYAKKIH